jgi:peptide chain release factor 1
MTDLLPRLEAIVDRFHEVGKMITDPTVISDMKRYPQLMKEYKDLGSIVETYNKYKNLLSNIQSAKDILGGNEDADMKEMALEELDLLLPQRETMEEDIKYLLILSC